MDKEPYQDDLAEHQEPVFPISEWQGSEYMENDEARQEGLESFKRHLWEREDGKDGVWAEIDKLD